jgi:hypothetical protein
VLGALGETYGNEQRWAITTSWRYFKSDRHYVGSDYQGHRDEEGSQVINHVNMAEATLRWNVNPRWSLSTTLPYFINERSVPLRQDGEVVGRSVTHAEGIGDLMVVGRRWMLDPATHPRTNWILGVGAKFPTGKPDVRDTRTRLVAGEKVYSLEEVDQSIQPGDGGWGALVDLSWFYALPKGPVSFYANASYLFNPEEKNGVATNRGRPSEAIMSVGDQYLARLGLTLSHLSWNGWSFSLGGRLEGMPAWDVLGGDEGFRRPGYSIAIEPSFAWSGGPHTVAASVPILQYRNRIRSVPDYEDDRHGDAAFADWVAMVTYSYRFGKAIAPSTPAVPDGDEEEAKVQALKERLGDGAPACDDPAFRNRVDRFMTALTSGT